MRRMLLEFVEAVHCDKSRCILGFLSSRRLNDYHVNTSSKGQKRWVVIDTKYTTACSYRLASSSIICLPIFRANTTL